MDYIVDRIPGYLRIDPESGEHGQGRRRKRGRQQHREDEEDCVDISPEARSRSAREGEVSDPEEPPAA